MKGLDIFFAVFDRHAIAEADALDLVVAHPDGGFRVDEQTLIRRTVIIDEHGIIIKANDKVKAADDPENMLKELA